jgi:hypothetical protein
VSTGGCETVWLLLAAGSCRLGLHPSALLSRSSSCLIFLYYPLAPPNLRATLVVCPVVAVIQWRGEIARYTEPGSLKVRWPPL